jgi:hypothetical protein
MNKPRIVIVPLAAALGGLAITPGQTAVVPAPEISNPGSTARVSAPNMFVSTGLDLLAFTVAEQADGTVVAQHQSHASHASHHSHYSSR